MKSSSRIYEKRVKGYSRYLKRLTKTMNIISLLRLLSAIAAIICITFIFRGDRDIITLGVSTLFIILFLYLVNLHQKYKGLFNYVEVLRDINQGSIDRLKGKWNGFEDKGEEFIDKEHKYSYDLDIFGRGSLYQWINTSKTYMGRNRLAYILSNPPRDKDTIKKRQEAIKELSNKRWWRQRLQSEAMMIKDKDIDKDDLLKWAGSKNEVYLKSSVITTIRLLPIITLTSFLGAYIIDIVPKVIPHTFLLIQFLLTFIDSKRRSKEFSRVYVYNRSIRVYRRILEHFEKGNFKSPYLIELKKKLESEDGLLSHRQLKNLESLVERILNKSNMLYFPLNIAFLLDYHNMIGLQKWKMVSGEKIEDWLNVIGEVEELSSLAIIGYDYPNWAIPEIVNKEYTFISKSIGHPLLNDKVISNDVSIIEPSRILLITGSNMSGKSTLLRTLGINLLLGYCGASVCAKDMRTSIMSIHTCMRISDDLERGISSFYGELLRIKEIVKASEGDGKVFFLLDEIFKGTNSYDRHMGAKTLIKQLYENGSMGLVSTHDLELEVLEKESSGNIKNYHFQEHYKNNKIHFDYKLRPGVSTTRNALYLMNMIGINIDK